MMVPSRARRSAASGLLAWGLLAAACSGNAPSSVSANGGGSAGTVAGSVGASPDAHAGSAGSPTAAGGGASGGDAGGPAMAGSGGEPSLPPVTGDELFVA